MSRQGVLAGGLPETLKAGEGGGRARFLGVEAFLFLGLGVSAEAAVVDLAGERDLSNTTGLVVAAAVLGTTGFLGLWRRGDGGGLSLRRRLEALAPSWSAWLEGPATGELGRSAGRSPRPLGCTGRTLAEKEDWAADSTSSAQG